MLSPKIIYQDKDFLVINKPAGMLVHGLKFKIQPSFAKASADAKALADKSAGMELANLPGSRNASLSEAGDGNRTLVYSLAPQQFC